MFCCCVKKSPLQSEDMYVIDIAPVGAFPKIPISYVTLQEQCRLGLTVEGRQYWWPYIPRIRPDSDIITHYPALTEFSKMKFKLAKEKSAYNRRSGISEVFGEERLSQKFNRDTTVFHVSPEQVAEILTLLADLYDIVDIGLFEPLTIIISSVIQNHELCFHIMCDIIERCNWYGIITLSKHNLKLYTFKSLIETYMNSSYKYLMEINALDVEYLNAIFIDHFSSILPHELLFRVMDIYLVEGVKVLHRVGLGILYLCRDIISSKKITRGNLFWIAVKERLFSGITFNQLYQASFQIVGKSACDFLTGWNFKRSQLDKLENIGKQNSVDELTSRSNLHFSVQRNTGRQFLTSSILGKDEASLLQSYIPDNIGITDGFKLVFSSQTHGYNIDTLYKRAENLYPCILIFKSTNKNAIFGAYITTPITPPSSDTVKGNGLSFCFRLNGLTPGVYRWSKLDNTPTVGNMSTPLAAIAEDEILFEYASDQFALFSNDFIAIGDETFGKHAIYIDGELSTCSSYASTTYANPPLVPEESTQPFGICEIELFAGADSIIRNSTSSASKSSSDADFVRYSSGFYFNTNNQVRIKKHK
jgi:hypothetical protein